MTEVANRCRGLQSTMKLWCTVSSLVLFLQDFPKLAKLLFRSEEHRSMHFQNVGPWLFLRGCLRRRRTVVLTVKTNFGLLHTRSLSQPLFLEKHLKEWILLGSLTICISPLSSLLTLIQSKGHLHFCDHLSLSVVAHTPAASYELDVLHRLLLCTLENEGLL